MLVSSPSVNGAVWIAAIVGAGVAVCLTVCLLVSFRAGEVGFMLINRASLWSVDWVRGRKSDVLLGSDVVMGWICWWISLWLSGMLLILGAS